MISIWGIFPLELSQGLHAYLSDHPFSSSARAMSLRVAGKSPFSFSFFISLIYVLNTFGKAFAFLVRCICLCCIIHICVRVTVALL